MRRVVRMIAVCSLFVVASGVSWAEAQKSQVVVTEAASAGADGTRVGSAGTPELSKEFGTLKRISMEFEGANLKDVLKTFSQQTGINVIAGGDLGDQPVTLYLEDVTSIDALDQILRASNLVYERPAGSEIYIVKPKTDGQTGPATITRVYRLRFARVSRSVLARAAATFGAKTPLEASLGQGSSGGSSGGGSAGGGAQSSSGGSGGSDSGGGGGASGKTTVGIDEIIQELVTSAGVVIVDGRTNSLIVTDVPENFPRIEGALAALDVRTAQILVDAELIETNTTKLKELGIKWGTGASGDLVTFTPTSRKTRFPFGSLGEGIAPSGPTPFTASTLDASLFKGVLEALESDNDTKILARPRVLTLDNESAIIRLTSDEAIGFSSSSQSTTGTETSTPERTTTGIVLVVTPQVNEQGYITMVVEPSVTKTVASKVAAPTGQSTPRDPKTRSSRTLVRIKTGETLVVGGLIDQTEDQTRRNVPVLSGIPFVGEAFKHTEVNHAASELIVFVTPRILDEPGTGSKGPAMALSSLGMREQEAPGSRQETIEQRLNTFEEH